jgi:hypothetical protein
MIVSTNKIMTSHYQASLLSGVEKNVQSPIQEFEEWSDSTGVPLSESESVPECESDNKQITFCPDSPSFDVGPAVFAFASFAFSLNSDNSSVA